ncbi:MAG: CBS domain-containing protein [Crenarchaeota archaeon]|nr:CBS domain-containing protein [Thermoproteota archaeon]
MKVSHLMIKDFIRSRKEASIHDVVKSMFEKHVGSVVILDETEKAVGIFTERDIIRVVAQNIPLNWNVEKVMTKNVYTVPEDVPFKDARQIILERKVRHLPVTDSEGKVVGLISIRQVYQELFEM